MAVEGDPGLGLSLVLANMRGLVNIEPSQSGVCGLSFTMKTRVSASRLNCLKHFQPYLVFALAVGMAMGGTIMIRAQSSQAKPPGSRIPAGATEAKASVASAPGAAPAAQKNASSEAVAEELSPMTSAVIKMADAGVAPAVIRTYVECSTSSAPLTAADIIALKKHEVPDDIVTLLLKQVAQVRAQAAQRQQAIAARTAATRGTVSGGLDPESYEYFQYYYLQPRAWASVYQRCPPYYYRPWGR